MTTLDFTYENALRKIMTEGVDRGDRTGTGTRSIFGLQMRWDLRDGFPLITTKQVYTRPMVEELLWMLSGSTDNNVLRNKNVHIWAEWQGESGGLGPIYGAQWRRWPADGSAVDLVKIRESKDDGAPEGVVERFSQINGSDIKNPGRSTGRVIHTKKCGDLRLLDRNPDGTYQGQFFDTGAVVNVGRPAATSIDDPYRPTFAGVGYIGEPAGVYTQAELSLWRGILKRCYLVASPSYALYGAKGVTVAKRWHCFANFHADLSVIPGNERWKNAGGALHLDKDYFGANQYGPYTTAFLPAADNTSMPGKAIEFRGKRYVSLRECEASTGVGRKVVLSQGGSVLIPPEGYNYRRIRYIDQIANVVEGIKANPESRRHIVSAWNVADLDKMALMPCHAFFQFYVANGKLSCQLYQRSADMFLGVPFNIASYALLTHMVAQQCGLEVGDFIWTGGDCHIYRNHFDQVNLQTLRTPLPLPELLLSPGVKSIFDYELGDVVFHNYKHHPAIKGEVAV